MLVSAVEWLLATLAIPTVGLGSVFVVSLISATLLPLGSEPAVFAVIKANQDLFWDAILVGTLGNTIGGAIDYWLGLGAKQFFARERETVWLGWLKRFGAKTLLLSWLPVVGDPLCALAGWLRLPFWPCVFYMGLGKFLRYLTMTGMLLQVPNGFWRHLGSLF